MEFFESNTVKEVFHRWKQGFPRVQVGGFQSRSASAYLLAHLFLKKEKCLVITSTAEEAVGIYDDLIEFFELFFNDQTASFIGDFSKKLFLFPGWETSPYGGLHPSIKNRLQRFNVLHQILKGTAQWVITDVSSFSQKVIAAEVFKNRTLELKVGTVIHPQKLEETLYTLGFNSSDPVEDPAFFCRRGYIFDIFSPAYKEPVRIEFFDDEIETIKFFNPTTQRTSAEPVSEYFVIPAQNWKNSPEGFGLAQKLIKEFCDNHDFPKKIRDDFFERVSVTKKDLTDEYLWPYFDSSSSHLAAYLKDWTLIQADSMGVEQELSRLLTTLKEGFERSFKEYKIAVPPEKIFLQEDDIHRALSTSSLLINPIVLDATEKNSLKNREETASIYDAPNPVETEIHPNFDVSVLTNEDLRAAPTNKTNPFENFSSKIPGWTQQKFLKVVISPSSTQVDRMGFLLEQKHIPNMAGQPFDPQQKEKVQILRSCISSGFRIPYDRFALVVDSELLTSKPQRSEVYKDTKETSDGTAFVSSLEDLGSEDLVVHSLHGIGKYRGLIKLDVDKIIQDFLLIEYAQNDKLYLPVYRLDQVQKYMGTAETVQLNKLGSGQFEKAKEKAKESIKELAHELLALYAKRAIRPGFVYSAPDETFREFEAKFPYPETPDQMKAIHSILDNMQQTQIMDRLVCGDVGFGKTEVAMRAAFKACLDGKQVAVLVPTTVLCFQHERTFKERFKDYAIQVNSVSRFKSAKEVKEALVDLKAGKVDIIVGTHRLLSSDVEFKNLGLIVIDEEHRFGVEHKEKLKVLKSNVDALTLTATPIPRTLQMSLFGLRDISVINTPPVNRVGVKTFVSRFDEHLIHRAITQELQRGGQIFFVHNRVQTINAMADQLKKIVPEAKVLVAHGQLSEKELETKMLDFYQKKYDILLCTTIIESGIDIPLANTMIINRADTFGLAQLYQLRGRVGRSQVRAFCYLLLPEEGEITRLAKKRLEVIQKFADLGSGFKIASHDLELRGGGDVLGKSQTGHVAAVGYELYTELLQEAIQELKGEPEEDKTDPEIKIPVTAIIPEAYIQDVQQRLSFYKRLAQSENDSALQDLELELQDRFGPMPEEVKNLLWLIRLKQIMITYCIKGLVAGKERLSLDAGEKAKISPAKFIALTKREPKKYTVSPDSKLLIRSQFQNIQTLYKELLQFFSVVH